MFYKNKITLVCFALIAVASCHEHLQNKIEKDIITKDTTSEKELNVNKTKNADSIINKKIYPGSDTILTKMYINGNKDRKILSVEISSGKNLFAVIEKNKNENIRINQIEMPDSTFDGPFGDSLHYKIKMPGMYKIIIGPDLMAEGKLSGNFILKVWVK